MLKQLNNYTENDNTENENLPDCKYRDTDYFSNLEEKLKSKSLSMLHLNISSLPKHFNDLENLISNLKLDLDIIGITESRLIKSHLSPTNIILDNYIIEHAPTESSAGGALIYINKKHSYKPRSDLNIYKAKKLESIFVELVIPNNLILLWVVYIVTPVWICVLSMTSILIHS